MALSLQFVHFRVFDPSIGGPSATCGVTLGFTEMAPGHIAYAVSYCSPNDVYNKSIGRSIVTARLQDPEHVLIAESSFEDFVGICRSNELHFQESYADLLAELDDYLDIGLPMAYVAYPQAVQKGNWLKLSSHHQFAH